MIKEDIIFLGKSTYALAVIIDIIKQNSTTSIAALVSNIEDEKNDSLAYEYLGSGFSINEYSIPNLKGMANKSIILASIGKSRKLIYQYFEGLIDYGENEFIDIIHPSSVIGSECKIGKGFHLSPLSVIAPFVEIGNFVVINRSVSIGHHTVLNDFCTINPGVTISGICTIGEQTTIGAGTTIIDKIKIGKNVIIGAGSLVTKDIPDNVVAYGCPAVVVRENH
jgi:sugar O-acyltransferase (sialic acid O-acetyltransferase NeuD family)